MGEIRSKTCKGVGITCETRVDRKVFSTPSACQHQRIVSEVRWRRGKVATERMPLRGR